MNDGLSTRTTRVVGGVLVAGALAASGLLWSSLPETMAIHWDASGTADGAAPKAIGAVGLPLLAAGLFVLFEALPRLDPLGENVAAFRGTYNLFVATITALLVAVHAVVLAANLGYEVDVAAVALALVGAIFLVTAVVLRRAEPNWFVGIRTPWTLSSAEVWERTHALGARLFALAGAVAVAFAAVAAVTDVGESATYGVLGLVVAVAVVPVAYSYYVYAKLDGPEDEPRIG